ncbi:WxcM-like domain-containing protein [Frigoriflavimonas asaccharolytica]|uniref:dTDP-4-dehydrorhamnose 3,5-epimerase-like enzyme n=1 Tax=Frigoriflavimonas asaccharolytica TaxID=2735899 RepID=A0A8J8K891_9FLAO|nr:WxcM-like domain-containing protein [Frigoriflavimonas asaccharolytica]NRS91712.1 dTDP-4-dehydrorhamnose 3,5-epimerase-like enzyme [Frigoriflavimonas asaccharolytica]
MQPKIIAGSNHTDSRGTLTFNNDFNMSEIKRVYTIENNSVNFVRAWQGHKIEQRWFSAIEGSFKIKLIEIDHWETPSKDLKPIEFILSSHTFDILHVPQGFISSIQALEEKSKLLLFSNFELNEIEDEYRFANDYFVG